MAKGGSVGPLRNQRERLWDLIADAIVAVYLRRRPDAQSPSKLAACFPFIYNMLDYLLIALPEGSHLLLAELGTNQGLSTATGGSVSVSEEILKEYGAPIGHGFSGQRQLWVAAAPHSKTGKPAATILREIVERAAIFASARGISLSLENVAAALALLLTHFSKSVGTHSSQERGSRDQLENDSRTIADVVLHTAASFDNALIETDGTYTLMLRYWMNGEPHLVQLNSRRPPSDEENEMKDLAERVFETGFSRWRWRDQRALVAIPCHFGGVPWLVSCRTVNVATAEAAQWCAYTTYRDHSIFNSTLRGTAERGLAGEMRRLLLAAMDSHRGGADLVDHVQRLWNSLPCVYPVSCPTLRKADSQQIRTQCLPVGDQDYEVCFSDSLSPLFLPYALPGPDAPQLWGPLSPEVVQRHFVYPVLVELRKQEVQRASDLVVGTYKIGHPLKDRMGPLRSALATVVDELESRKDHLQILQLVKVAQERASRVESLGHLLDLISRAISTRQGSSVFRTKKEWNSDAPYRLGKSLREVLQSVNEVERHPVRVPDIDLQVLTDGEIECWIREGFPLIRPANLFYREILTEIVTNVSRRGRPDGDQVALSIGLQAIPDEEASGGTRRCVVFSNQAFGEIRVDALGIEPNAWKVVNLSRGGAVGGLYFVANCLEQTLSGRLYVRVDKGRGGDVFHAGLWLKGMTGFGKERSPK